VAALRFFFSETCKRSFNVPYGAINPFECYATTNIPEGDFGTGIGPVTTDELVAAAGKDGRPAGETCPVLLAAPGGESSDATVGWQHAAVDSRAVRSGGVAEAVAAGQSVQSHQRGWSV